ncbi:hypothetical protein E4U42_002666 [Claviceps africana]|uniref:Cell wall protein PhiA n=1 Tax=Claviceps africana TaxID=83212 RepID=A0A8K0J956_9HYPO|nr:hypothetical protein E4U42_002666 [Claviceps africana]
MKFSAVFSSAFMAGTALALGQTVPDPPASPELVPKVDSPAPEMAPFDPGFGVGGRSVKPKPENFQLVALKSPQPFHGAWFQASHGGLLLKLADQKATCQGQSYNYATFHLQNKQLFLYSGDAEKHQQIYVDRSAMGQGILRFADQGSALPKNAELQGWDINDAGMLVFNGVGFQACPGHLGGAWQVWLNTVRNPAGNKGCVSFNALASKDEKPVSCHYTTTEN